MAISKIILNGVTQMDVTGDTVTAATLMSPKTAHGADGVQITGTAVEKTLTTKSITANGTYNASSDNADGYSSVTVNVSGGASNIVTGTFKGTTTGAAMDVTLNYTGNGYPVAAFVYVGAANIYVYNDTIQRYTIRDWCFDKYPRDSTPDYTGTSGAGKVTVRYKNSASSATSYSTGGTGQTANTTVIKNTDATASSADCIHFKSKTKMSVFIASSSYGFMANVEYEYVIIYSS